MIYFTSDLHFYRDKIIRHCNRPFRDVLEMNDKIINIGSVLSHRMESYIKYEKKGLL